MGSVRSEAGGAMAAADRTAPSRRPWRAVLRLFSAPRLAVLLPRPRPAMGGLSAAVRWIGTTLATLVLVFCLFAALATKLLGSSFPDWFGSLGESLLTLLRILTTDTWSSSIMAPVTEVYPLAALLFAPFILIVTFVVLDFLIRAVIKVLHRLPRRTAARRRARGGTEAGADSSTELWTEYVKRVRRNEP